MAPSDKPNSYGFSDHVDVILRSSNNIDFYVIGAILRHVSPVFDHMFTSCGSDNNEKKDNLLVVPVAEDSETLRLLLDIIYPYEKKPQLSSPIVGWKVSKASQKYMMDIIESKLKRQFVKSKLIAEKPLNMYAIAINLGWEEIAIDAARQTLTTPFEKLECVDELKSISAADFYRFLEYRHQCKNSKNPQEEVLPPLRRHSSIKTCTNTSGSDTPHSDQVETLPSANASEPYNRSKLSDLILRTSDGVDFYVFAALLRFSSPFFDRKFPLENPVTRNGLAVIAVQDDSNVLRLLLGFIYPTQEPDIQSVDLYAQLVFAARRYEMTNIEDRVRKHATASSLVTAEPLRIYAVASALDWTSLAKTVALNTLRTPFHGLVGFVDEMHLMTSAHLFHLMRFRLLCTDAACDVLKTSTFNDHGYRKWTTWPHYNSLLPDDLYERLNACPRGSTVIDVYEQGLSKGIIEAQRAGIVNHNAYYNALRSMQDTPEAVERAVLKVDFPS